MFPPASSLSQLCKCYCSEIQCIAEKARQVIVLQVVLETCYSSGKWGLYISFQVVNPLPQPLPFHRVLRRLRMLNSSCVTLSSFLDLSELHFHHQSSKNTYVAVLWGLQTIHLKCFPGGSDGKESACSIGDPGSILGWEEPLEKAMASHSSILVWRIQWPEEPGGLQSMWSQRVGHDWATNTRTWHLVGTVSVCVTPGVLISRELEGSLGHLLPQPICSYLNPFKGRMWSQAGLRKHHYEQI